MPTFAGRILLADGAPRGWLAVEGGKVMAWGKGAPPEPADVVAHGWIVPAPVNAHTHVADACLRSKPGKPTAVADLVGPGGWKARHLAAATTADVAAGIRSYVGEMAAIGTAAFVDFREGGVTGARVLSDLRDDLACRPIILGRPVRNDFSEKEAEALLPVVDGIGLSALRDFDKPRDAERWAEACHDAGKPFAVHVSEAVREPMDAVVALEPAFVVHATQAKGSDLDMLAGADIPVVLCPRSNAYHGLRPPVSALMQAGVRLALGTDNGMLQDGNLLRDAAAVRDAAAAQRHAQHPAELGDEDLLRMLTYNARSLAGMETSAPRPGLGADLVVLPADPFPAALAQKPGFVMPTEDA